MGQTQLFSQVSFVSVSLSDSISFCGGALREELLALKTLQGEDPKKILDSCMHAKMYFDYQQSHTFHVLYSYIRTRPHRVIDHISLLIFAQSLCCIH